MTRQQLLAADVTPEQIRRRFRAGSLLAVFRGVYRVGHTAPSFEANYLAAVRACGDGALLGGAAGGYLFALVKGRPPPPEVVAPKERRVPGLRVRIGRRQGTIHAWEQDHRREREAHARGDDFRRYTWHDVAVSPAPMLAELRKLLV